MILSLVSELLSRVARRPEIEEALDALRRSAGEVRLAGLTDPAKAFVSAVATAQLGRPTILIVESNQRAEMLVEQAVSHLRTFDEGRVDLLKDLAYYVLKRRL